MKFSFREMMFKIWYWYVNKIDKNAEILFMNFGYSNGNQGISLDEPDELNRYPIQLYHHLVSTIKIKNKDVVEIGCGRGGGLFYITKNFSPASAKGVELNKKAVTFCNQHYSLNGLIFLHGDAQNLNLKNNSCDVVINVESSHRYSDIKAFLEEVSRILRPDGYFLFADFRYDYEMEDMRKELELCGMSVLKERFINKEVVAALKLDDHRKRILVKKLIPKFFYKMAQNFAGIIGSETYNRFVSHKYIYFSYVLKKL